jgi:MinD superfamily P-loop ATPase
LNVSTRLHVAIASGKGGTGKTTVAVNLALALGGAVHLLDCDVEAPNAHLFLRAGAPTQEMVTLPVPLLDPALCDGCRECSKFCSYHAIAVPGGKPLIFPELCHGCGGCVSVCPRGALAEGARRIGVIETRDAGPVRLVQGRLDVGVAMAPPLIRAVREKVADHGMVIVDAPPGTSCPVVAALRGADAAIMVTEPTPFGLHDLELAVEMVRRLGLPFGVVVNRVGVGDRRVHSFCAREGIFMIGEIPDDRRIAEAYSRGEPLVEALPEFRPLFDDLLQVIVNRWSFKEASHANL